MKLLSKKFEAEERAFINEVIEQGALFEDVAKIRKSYGEDFLDEKSFEKFKEEVCHKLLKK
jgi:hypothetical protein